MKQVLTSLAAAVSLYASSVQVIPFSLPDLYNPSVTITQKSLKNKVVLVNLWASWCSGCKEEMPKFVKLQKEFSKNKFQILLVNIDSNPNDALNFLHTTDGSYILDCVHDSDKTLPKAYHAVGMPSSYLIDQNGNVITEFIGSLNDQDIATLKQKIYTLLGE